MPVLFFKYIILWDDIDVTNTDCMIWLISKLRDSRTTAIEFPSIGTELNQGIFIDIFPLDDVFDEVEKNKRLYIMKREMNIFFGRQGKKMNINNERS